MSRLRSQLQELETYAYETGEGGLPSNVLLERQNFILQQLKAQMALNLEEIEVLRPDELKDKVDSAIKEVNCHIPRRADAPFEQSVLFSVDHKRVQ